MKLQPSVVSALILTLFFSGLYAHLHASVSTGTVAAQTQAQRYFIGCNVLSPLPSFLPTPGNTIFSVLSNLECGFGLSGGTVINECHSLEARLAFGPSSHSELIFNAQGYYHFYPMRYYRLRMKGLYTGAGVRYWDLYHDLTGIHRHNFATELSLGYRFRIIGPTYLDVRFSEIISVYTWLSRDHLVPGWATVLDRSMPKNPLLSFDFGVYF